MGDFVDTPHHVTAPPFVLDHRLAKARCPGRLALHGEVAEAAAEFCCRPLSLRAGFDLTAEELLPLHEHLFDLGMVDRALHGVDDPEECVRFGIAEPHHLLRIEPAVGRAVVLA